VEEAGHQRFTCRMQLHIGNKMKRRSLALAAAAGCACTRLKCREFIIRPCNSYAKCA
jgi:hypothetical protein